jgi:hypothetical protein
MVSHVLQCAQGDQNGYTGCALRDVTDPTRTKNNVSVVHGLTSLPYLLLPRATMMMDAGSGAEVADGIFAIRKNSCIKSRGK